MEKEGDVACTVRGQGAESQVVDGGACALGTSAHAAVVAPPVCLLAQVSYTWVLC